MVGYRKWKKYRSNPTFLNYCNYVVLTVWRDIVGAVRSSYLCIRFPFLYRRNAWTGKHYNSKADRKRNDLFQKWNEYSQTHQKEYYERLGGDAINLLVSQFRYILMKSSREAIYIRNM